MTPERESALVDIALSAIGLIAFWAVVVIAYREGIALSVVPLTICVGLGAAARVRLRLRRKLKSAERCG